MLNISTSSEHKASSSGTLSLSVDSDDLNLVLSFQRLDEVKFPERFFLFIGDDRSSQ